MTRGECYSIIKKHSSYSFDQKFHYFCKEIDTKGIAFAMCEQGCSKHVMFDGVDDTDTTRVSVHLTSNF